MQQILKAQAVRHETLMEIVRGLRAFQCRA
jgi:hypothetical protein